MAKVTQLDSNPDCFDPRACVVTTICTSPEVGMWARWSGLCPASIPGREVLPGGWRATCCGLLLGRRAKSER